MVAKGVAKVAQIGQLTKIGLTIDQIWSMNITMQYFWEKQGWEASDRHLLALQEAPFRRDLPPLPEGAGLFMIRGPRQIGKSCWIKTLLKNSEPKRSFYLSCENLRDHLDLAEVLSTARDRHSIFLDEITFVEEWWRAVKHHLEYQPKVRMILTGSHSLDVKKGMDQMPGRWGNGGDFELLPMTFEEFSAMRGQTGWPHLDRVDLLTLYFRIGGFPIALIESGPEGRTPLKSMETFRRWLLGDLIKAGKQEQYLREILFQIAQLTCSRVSLQKLAQRTQMGSHNTAQDYVEVLEHCFAIKTLFSINLDTGVPHFRKEKKFYFRDPLLYWLALEWVGAKAPHNAMEQLAETVAHEQLHRLYKRMGYASTNKGEIDFVKAGEWALEVKWQDFPEGLSRVYKDLRIPQKIFWTKGNFLMEWPTANLA